MRLEDRPAVRTAEHLEVAPGDPPGARQGLQRLPRRFLGRESRREAGRGIGAGGEVASLALGEQPGECPVAVALEQDAPPSLILERPGPGEVRVLAQSSNPRDEDVLLATVPVP